MRALDKILTSADYKRNGLFFCFRFIFVLFLMVSILVLRLVSMNVVGTQVVCYFVFFLLINFKTFFFDCEKTVDGRVV